MTSYSNQTWRYTGTGNQLDEATIEKYWNEDKYITSAAYTSHGWFFAMNKGVKWTNQSYKYVSSWPDTYIHEQRDKGYMITTLATSESNWFVVTSYNTGYTDQQICAAPWSTLKDWIKKYWDMNYYITSIACRNNLWTVVMSKGAPFTQQAYMWANSATDIVAKIKNYFDQGYRITACEYDGSKEFFCVMSKSPISAATQESIHINASEDPSSFIKEGWDKGWNIT
ncbi:MAG: hypothetical protein LUC91_01730, partial [Prevotella sp.]|nr:hypothetical protein [Prevotella sp.]